MGFQTFLVVMFLLGIGAEANPMERCLETVKLDEEFGLMIDMASEQQLNAICETMTNFFTCANDVMITETGFSLKELAGALAGTDVGKVLKFLVNIQDLLQDMCTEGTELRNEYLANAQCYKVNVPDDAANVCEQQAKDAYASFRELQNGTIGWRPLDEPCVLAVYQLGCLGAEIQEQCGEQGFEFYKKVVKKMGFFKIGLCPSNIMNTIKTDFLDGLEITEDKKSLYRVIVNLRRRRR